MLSALWIIFWLFILTVLAFQRASLSVWTISLFVFLMLCSYFSHFHAVTLSVFWLVHAAIFIPLNFIPLRRDVLSRAIFRFYKQVMPALSDTEREALNAGSVGWEAELFSGMPQWDKLQQMPISTLSAEEKAFMEGPVETFCTMVDSWTMHHTMNIPDELLNYLRRNGF